MLMVPPYIGSPIELHQSDVPPEAVVVDTLDPDEVDTEVLLVVEEVPQAVSKAMIIKEILSSIQTVLFNI